LRDEQSHWQAKDNRNTFVMAGLVPAIRDYHLREPKDVDAQHKAGHDEVFLESV
jgi:hypothetical protein